MYSFKKKAQKIDEIFRSLLPYLMMMNGNTSRHYLQLSYTSKGGDLQVRPTAIANRRTIVCFGSCFWERERGGGGGGLILLR